jgi:hypothetical protein
MNKTSRRSNEDARIVASRRWGVSRKGNANGNSRDLVLMIFVSGVVAASAKAKHDALGVVLRRPMTAPR